MTPCTVANSGGVSARFHDLSGQSVQLALPGEVVEMLGISGVPAAGEDVHAVDSERAARR